MRLGPGAGERGLAVEAAAQPGPDEIEVVHSRGDRDVQVVGRQRAVERDPVRPRVERELVEMPTVVAVDVGRTFDANRVLPKLAGKRNGPRVLSRTLWTDDGPKQNPNHLRLA